MGGALPCSPACPADGNPDRRRTRRVAANHSHHVAIASILYMPPQELEHPALDQLAATPEILRILMASVTDEIALTKPAPDRWSIAEVLEHLSHVEGHMFRV